MNNVIDLKEYRERKRLQNVAAKSTKWKSYYWVSLTFPKTTIKKDTHADTTNK